MIECHANVLEMAQQILNCIFEHRFMFVTCRLTGWNYAVRFQRLPQHNSFVSFIVLVEQHRHTSPWLVACMISLMVDVIFTQVVTTNATQHIVLITKSPLFYTDTNILLKLLHDLGCTKTDFYVKECFNLKLVSA